MIPKMKVKLDEGAYAPVHAHSDDAGYDLLSPVNVAVKPGKRVTIDTGVHIAVPNGYSGMVFSKSGLMSKHGVYSTGLVDAGYTGSVKAVLINTSDRPFLVHRGMKITQIVITPVVTPEIEIADELDETERGEGGLGSTGV